MFNLIIDYAIYIIASCGALILIQFLRLIHCARKQEKTRVRITADYTTICEKMYSIICSPSENALREELHQLRDYVGKTRERHDILSKVFFEYLATVQSGDEQLQLSLFRVLKTIDPVKFYSGMLERGSAYEKAHACRMLAEYAAQEQVKNIEKHLSSTNSELAFSAAMALSRLGDESGVIKFISGCKDNYRISKRLVLQLLGEYTEDIKLLAKLVFKDCDDYTKATVIKALAKYNIRDFIGIYMDALRSKNATLRVSAVSALGNFGDPAFESEIIMAANDRMWIVRNAAVKALGNLDTPSALQTVSNATSDGEWWVRYNAAKTLVGMKDGLVSVNEILSHNDNYASDAIKYVLYRDYTI